MQKLQKDLRRYDERCLQLTTENKKLREEGAKTVDVLNEQVGAAKLRLTVCLKDDISLCFKSPYLQVRAQVETLIAEKARLAQENARLVRENLGLQVRIFVSVQWRTSQLDSILR